MITKLDFVGIPSTDLERSRAFYVDTLGLRPDPQARFECWAFDTGVCHMAFFTDPDGNDLMLHHRYKSREEVAAETAAAEA
jgi:catechol 2,3-dioxygenase-like lactoylglutathione lyase family enzyme